MKKLTLILLIVMGFTGEMAAQAHGDSTLVLQKIINLPELQQYLPIESDGSIKQLYIAKYPVSFSSDISLSKDGRKVKFMSTSELTENKIEAYFMFRNLKINQNSAGANVNFFYDFNYTSRQFKSLTITIELFKNGKVWSVFSNTIKENTK
jgi:hypothetical protein